MSRSSAACRSLLASGRSTPVLPLVALTVAAVVCLLPAAAAARGTVIEDWHGTAGDAWKTTASLDFKGWQPTSTGSGYVFGKVNDAGSGGLVATTLFDPHAGLGTGEWRWQAPGTSTIYRAEYGAASFAKEGCLNEGLRTANSAWQPTVNYRAGAAPGAKSVHPTACGANSTVTGAPVTTKDGNTAVTITGAPSRQTFCSDATACGLEGSPIGNAAVFGIERIKQGRPGSSVYLPGAKLSLTDYDVPLIVSADNSHPRWVRSAQGTVSVVASDTGLGVKAAAVGHATLTDLRALDAQTHPCGGDRNDRCPADWNAERPSWTTSWPYDTDLMPEGVQPFGVSLRDIVDNRSPATGADETRVPPSKIDRSAPDPISGGGEVPALSRQWTLGNDRRSLTATVQDRYSGVASMVVETTSGEVLDRVTLDCPDDQCPRDATRRLEVDTTSLPEGVTSVRLRATDLVENTATSESWDIKIDRSDPTDVEAEGDLRALADRYTRGLVPVTVAIRAGDRYSGVEQLIVETEAGQRLTATSLDCPEAQCDSPVSRALSVDLAQLAEGRHVFRVGAIDLLGHRSWSAGWPIMVDRTPPQVPAGFQADYDTEDRVAVVDWDVSADPVLPDGTVGAGTAGYELRIGRGNPVAWSGWQTTDDSSFDIADVEDNEALTVDVRARDAVENTTPSSLFSFVAEEGSGCEDPADVPKVITSADFEGTVAPEFGDVSVYTLQTPLTQDQLLDVLPAGAEPASVMEQVPPTEPDGGYTSQLSIASDLSTEQNLDSWADYLMEDAKTAKQELEDEIDVASTASARAGLRSQVAVVEARIDELEEHGPRIRSFAVSSEPGVVDALDAALSGRLQTEPDDVSPQDGCALGTRARVQGLARGGWHDVEANGDPVATRAGGNDGIREPNDYGTHSYQPRRVSVTTQNGFKIKNTTTRVRQATLRWQWGSNARRRYWLKPSRSTDGRRGFEIGMQLDRDGAPSDEAWGAPIWGAGKRKAASQPWGPNYKKIPNAWTTNFSCGYAEDYYRDDTDNSIFKDPYTITVGSSCRPVRKRMPGKAQLDKISPNQFWFRWTHMLLLNYKDGDDIVTYDDNDRYSVDIVPVHWARPNHDFPVPVVGDASEVGDICKDHGDGKPGSCMFEDHMLYNSGKTLGGSKHAKYLNADGTEAFGETADGLARKKRFLSRSSDPLGPR